MKSIFNRLFGSSSPSSTHSQNYKLIVGLGNPGDNYANTRHNAGFELVEEIAKVATSHKPQVISGFQFSKKFQAEIVKGDGIILAKPQTFMNNSGQSVRALVDYYRIPLDQLWVAHDDLDITLGEYKIMLAKGPKIHNGLASVEQHLGSKDFWRIRLGVDSRSKEERGQMSGAQYVLKKLSRQEQAELGQVVDQIIQEM